MAGKVNLADIPAEVRARLNLPRAPRKSRSLSKNAVRTAAIRVLNVVADLSPQERRRVLKHAAALNDV